VPDLQRSTKNLQTSRGRGVQRYLRSSHPGSGQELLYGEGRRQNRDNSEHKKGSGKEHVRKNRVTFLTTFIERGSWRDDVTLPSYLLIQSGTCRRRSVEKKNHGAAGKKREGLTTSPIPTLLSSKTTRAKLFRELNPQGGEGGTTCRTQK